MNVTRLKNRSIAKIITKFPFFARFFIDSYAPWETEDIPWTPALQPLHRAKVSIVTTAGVHHKDQQPFNMNDPEGDPSYRIIDLARPLSDLMITHDYYDHADADRDINVVFPVERMREFEKEGIIGQLADIHYGIMGHIDGRHIQRLIHTEAPDIAGRLKADSVDVVLLTPG